MAKEDDSKLPVYKVSLCGKSEVGKTSIFRRIRGDGFRDDTSQFSYLAEDKIKIEVKNKTIKIHVVDTAGMERRDSLTRQHFLGSHAVLFVYDCDDSQSLNALKGYYKSAKDHASGAAMVLVRNKIDKDSQCVDVREANNLVYNASVCQFMIKAETSALKNIGIEELFKKVGDYLIKNAEPSNKRSNKFEEIRLHVQGEPEPQTNPQSRARTTAAASQSSRCGC